MKKESVFNARDWAPCFAGYPLLKEIYVVGNQPFHKKSDAQNYAATTKLELQKVTREEATITPAKEAAAKEAAAKEAAAKEAAAKEAGK